MEHTTAAVSGDCSSKRIHDIHQRITEIKSNEEVGVKYMQEWEEKIIEQRKAREEGREEERKAAILTLIRTLRKLNVSEEQILESVMGEYDLSEEQAREYLTR